MVSVIDMHLNLVRMSDSTDSLPTLLSRSSEDDPVPIARARPPSPRSMRVRRAHTPARSARSPDSAPVTPTDALHSHPHSHSHSHPHSHSHSHSHSHTAEPLQLDARTRFAELFTPQRDKYFAPFPDHHEDEAWRSPTPRSPASVPSPLPPPPRRAAHSASTSIADSQSLKSVMTTTSDPARPTDAMSIRSHRPSDTLSLRSDSQHLNRRADPRSIFPDPHHWGDGSDTDDDDSLFDRTSTASPELGFGALRGDTAPQYAPRSAGRYVSLSSTHTVIPAPPRSSSRSSSSHPLRYEPSPFDLSITMPAASASTWSIGTFGTVTAVPRDELPSPVSLSALGHSHSSSNSPGLERAGGGEAREAKSPKGSLANRSNRVRPAPIRANAAVYARLARHKAGGDGTESAVPRGKELGLDKNLHDGGDVPASASSASASASAGGTRAKSTTLLAKAISNKSARARVATPTTVHDEDKAEPPDPELRELLRLQRKALGTSEPKVVRLFKNALLKPFDPRD